MIIEPSEASSTQTSQKMKLSDNPPAYTEAYRSATITSARTASSSRSARAAPNKSLPDRPINLQSAVDQVHIYNRKSEINGVFHVDPLIPLLDVERRHKHHHKGHGQSKRDPIPHASFRTRHSEIDISLATNGDFKQASRANVSVSNMSKDLKITLLPAEPSQPRLALNAASKHGTVVLLIPPNFSGIVRMQTPKGSLEILPALARRIKIAKRTEHEIIFMRNGDEDDCPEANYCDLTSRTGKVVVGLRDQDQYVPAVGFWKKFGSSFSRKESDNSQ